MMMPNYVRVPRVFEAVGRPVVIQNYWSKLQRVSPRPSIMREIRRESNTP
jgi:hypothetical protein